MDKIETARQKLQGINAITLTKRNIDTVVEDVLQILTDLVDNPEIRRIVEEMELPINIGCLMDDDYEE